MPAAADEYARWAGKRLPRDAEYQAYCDFSLVPSAVPSLDLRDLGLVWELTSDSSPGVGWVVRGGPWRDRDEPAEPENQSFENRPMPDVGFRCVCDPGHPGLETYRDDD